MSLTVKRVARAISRGEPGAYLDRGGVRGLYLVVASPTAAHWELRYQLNGRTRQMGLGSARDLTLEAARVRAKKSREALADKIDPLIARRAERARLAAAEARMMPFAEAARSYIEQHRAKWNNAKRCQQWTRTLRTYVEPIIGKLPVADIDVTLVLRVLEQRLPAALGFPAGSFWTTRPETASRTRGRIEAILDWATARGFRSGDNPAAWKTIGKVLPARAKLAKVEHHAALPYAELPAFMAALREREGTAAQALQFTILTAARSGEVIGAKWSEIDSATWTVPAGRMKASRAHRVPLAPPVVELLDALYREDGNDFLFIGPRSDGLSDAAMNAVLKRMDRGDLTVHGFRSSFRDWAAEQTSFPHDVVEMALAHAVGTSVERAYKRTDLFDRRRKLMETWARFALTGASAKVTPIRSKVS